jgi:hypothetical protein
MLFRLLFRILSGEPLRKATPAEVRLYSGAFVFIPIFLACFVYFGHSLLGRASGFGIWLYATACLLIAGLIVAAWVRFVPPRVSVITAIIVWIFAFWIAWHIDLAKISHD